MTSTMDDSLVAGSENQSIAEVLIRVLTTHIVGILLFQRYCTLANVPSKRRKSHIIIFLFYPGIIASQICLGAYRAVKYQYRHQHRNRKGQDEDGGSAESPDFQFYLGGIIGVWATQAEPLLHDNDDNNTIPGDNTEIKQTSVPPMLFEVEHYTHLRRVLQSRPLSWAWVGRLFTYLILIAHSVGTFVVFIRRQQHGCELVIDLTLGTMAFASALTGLLVPCLECMSTRWVIETSSPLITTTDNEPEPEPTDTTPLLLQSQEGNETDQTTQTNTQTQPKEWHPRPNNLVKNMIIAGIAGGLIRKSVLLEKIPIELFKGQKWPILWAWILSWPVVLFVYVFPNARFSRWLMDDTTWFPVWRPLCIDLIVIGLVATVVVDLVFYGVYSVIQLFNAGEGCWRDPISGILFVI